VLTSLREAVHQMLADRRILLTGPYVSVCVSVCVSVSLRVCVCGRGRLSRVRLVCVYVSVCVSVCVSVPLRVRCGLIAESCSLVLVKILFFF